MLMLGVTALVGMSPFLAGTRVWLDCQGSEDQSAGTAARSVTLCGAIPAVNGGVMLSVH